MKKLFALVALVVACVVSSCEKFDDTEIWNKLDDHENRISKLEELCKQMNTNISSLQTLVNALQNNDFVTAVTPVTKDGETVGYTITFTKSQPITIYHGEDGKDGADGKDGQNGADGKDGQDGKDGVDGKDGQDGKDGVDGKDGATPIIGVKQDTDGIYYWTLNGDWLLDAEGNKIKAQGTDGKDGQDGANGADGNNGADGQPGTSGADGKDGITPQLKIENGKWYVSYDNGSTWVELGQATGEQGPQGPQGDPGLGGDSMFTNIDYSNENYVLFTLSNGTQIQVPTWYAFEQLQTLCNQMNTNITALQTIVTALQTNDYVQSITPLMENGKEIGYTITFSKSGTVTIYHGKDGQNGQDGTNGTNGVDGHTPQIGVKQDTDGIYYWTLNGDWLLDAEGNKIKAQGTDGKDGADGKDGQDGAPGKDGADGKDGQDGAPGKDGEDGKDGQDGAPGKDGEDGKDGVDGADGKDGITPQLKIENDYWYISYDNGQSWTQLGKATGEDGKDGEDGSDGASGSNGDSFFKSVKQDDKNVYFTLADGTTITIPKAGSIENIVLTYIPRYSDGKATVFYVNKADSYVELDFEVSPASAVADWSNIAKVNAIYTETRAGIEKVNMDILAWTADKTNGIITVKASGKNLSDNFFAGKQQASARLAVNGNGINVISDYVPMVAKREKIQSNEIWYTSTDGNIVEPYAKDAFGVAIKSNTYENGNGVITFDGDVKTIGKNAFSSCTSLASITLPEGVTSIGEYAFYMCMSLASITLPEGVTMIGRHAFRNCTSLVSVTIPETVKDIGAYAFMYCTGLQKVYISDIVAWCEIVFEDQRSNPLSNGAALYLDGELVEHLIVPEGVKTIGDYAFWHYASLTSITLLEGLTEIGIEAFANCINLTSITIPKGVTTIGSGAFRECAALTSLKIPESVTTIGDQAFYWCTKLPSVAIPEGVKTIGHGAFRNCYALASVTIPNSITTIGNEAFCYCQALTSITIPESVTTIGDWAFYICSKLHSVYCNAKNPPVGGSEMFHQNASNRKFYVPAESVDAYKAAWSEYADSIEPYTF